jgi:hypothetical protein
MLGKCSSIESQSSVLCSFRFTVKYFCNYCREMHAYSKGNFKESVNKYFIH